MKKIVILFLAFIVSFFGTYSLHKAAANKESKKEITMAGVRGKRWQAIQKALREGKKEYEFKVGYIMPLSE